MRMRWILSGHDRLMRNFGPTQGTVSDLLCEASLSDLMLGTTFLWNVRRRQFHSALRTKRCALSIFTPAVAADYRPRSAAWRRSQRPPTPAKHPDQEHRAQQH